MNKTKSFILICTCVLMAACSSKPQEQLETKKIMVETSNLKTLSLEKTIKYPSQIEPAKQVPVTGKLAGKVDQVFFSEGDYVSAGETLYTLDGADLENNIKTMEAQVETAKTAVNSAESEVLATSGSKTENQKLQSTSSVNQAENNVKQAKMTVEQKELSVQQAQNAYDNALEQYNNNKTLFDSGVISESQYNQSEINLTNAQTSLESAQAAVTQAQGNLDLANLSLEQSLQSQDIVNNLSTPEAIKKSEDALSQAKAQLNLAEVNLNIAREKLNDLSVTSPISGVISTKNIEPKTVLAANTVPFTILQTETIEVKVNVTESIINKVSIGQSIKVIIDAIQEEHFEGTVVYKSPAADAGKSFEIRIAIKNSDNLIKPGMFAETIFTKDYVENATVLDRTTVLQEGSKYFVFVNESGIAKKVPVNVGIESGEYIQIVDGLDQSANVIVKGHRFLKDNNEIYVDPAVVEEGKK